MEYHDAIHTNATASPLGDEVAYVRNNAHVLKHKIYWNEAPTSSYTDFPRDKKVKSLKWSADASQILAVWDAGINVMDSDRREDRVNIRNGSGSLGKIMSADFVGNDHLLVIWEFGKAKLWHMNSSKASDLPDLKTTCDGRAWGLRPGPPSQPLTLFALLSRIGAEDHLLLQFSSLEHKAAPIKLQTSDAQSISWSPDGKWLSVLDVPTANPSVYIYTADGHCFRSYPPSRDVDNGLGIKHLAWSPDGRLLALAKHDGRVELLNTKTFSPQAMIQHHTTIDQCALLPEQRAPVWQEEVSASYVRSYSLQPQPMSPPLSKTKQGPEPSDLGVAETCFSCDGSYIATRDCRMLNTIWLWNAATLSTQAVIIQHSDVRSLIWHPSQPDTLMIDCAEGIAHVFRVSSSGPPVAHATNNTPRALLSWISTPADAKPVIMARSMNRFEFIFPDGNDHELRGTSRPQTRAEQVPFEDGASEDSLFEVLSGRKPLPPKTEPSYTEMVDLDIEAEDTMGGGLEDTFREKKQAVQAQAEVDPFDDSEIF